MTWQRVLLAASAVLLALTVDRMFGVSRALTPAA